MSSYSWSMYVLCIVVFGSYLRLLFQPILSDGVVVWRACILWQGNRPALIVVLCFLLGGSVGEYCYTLFFLWKWIWQVGMQAAKIIFGKCLIEQMDSVLCHDGSQIAYGLVLSTNIVATSSISITAWWVMKDNHFASLVLILFRQHRRLIKASFGRHSKRTLAEKILALLIESGMLYCSLCVS